jgi:hypothetical protein
VVYDSIRAFLSISPSSSEEVDELPEQDDNCKIFARRNKVKMYFFIEYDTTFLEVKQASRFDFTRRMSGVRISHRSRFKL